MDYILNHINNDLAICDENSYEYVVSLRKRIEYILFVLTGYLWNKNADDLLIDDRQRIIASFDRMSIGDVVSAITSLDVNKEILHNKKARTLIGKYPGIRNIKMGHGYALGSDLVSTLSPLYDDLIAAIPLLQSDHSLIIVERNDSTQYYGLRIDANAYGQKNRWACPKDNFPDENEFPRTYIQINNQYFKLSPFITLNRKGLEIEEFVFSSLTDSLTGQIKLCPLFGNIPEKQEIYSEFARFSEADEYREVGSNGTVMNCFDCNHQTYQDVGFTKIVMDFLLRNKANVSATLWGHGGVGKTACIQNVCQQLFCSKELAFSYIIFITAKDRIYNPATGKISGNKSKYVRHYSEVIETITQTVFPDTNFQPDKLNVAEKQIQEYSGKLLIVIDDYETFIDEEKHKISEFIKTLDINHHKVIITTRNLRLSIGTPIPTSELDSITTCRFLQEIIDRTCPELSDSLKKELSKVGVPEKVLAATNGRPIFIYQFAYLFMQNGMRQDIFSALYSGKDAQDFLYGRVYEYLTDTAKSVFATIPSVVNDDLLFRFDMLKYVLSKEITDDDKFEGAVDELVNQLVIERYSDSQGRVYAQELLSIMQTQFSKLADSRKETIRRLIESLGGKEISGTIEEAMLREADQSRLTGNVAEIISKYRRVLNQKNSPIKIRKQALLNAASYLSANDLNAKAAGELIKEYLPMFKDDEQIAYQYVVCLWQQEDRKLDAVTFIREFFSKASGHKKTSNQYLQFFALGTSYCTYYDAVLRSYDTIEKRRTQLRQTINEFGRELFDAATASYSKLRSGVKHVVQMGLVQTAKTCCEFDAQDMSKLKLGLEICEFSFDRFTHHFVNQSKLIHEKITRKIKLIESQKTSDTPDTNSIPFWWDSFITDGYSVNDCVDGFISGIVPYGVFVKFGKESNYKGLLHISKISHEFLPSEHLPTLFSYNQQITVKIINIDYDKKRIDLVLKEML